jgi:hypothetical protein
MWKMLSMEVIYVNDKISPVLPLSGPADFKGAGDFPRQSYKIFSILLEPEGILGKARPT